jgi:hypothetical protein
MSLVTLECLDDGNTIDVPVDKTVIGRGSFLKVFSLIFTHQVDDDDEIFKGPH